MEQPFPHYSNSEPHANGEQNGTDSNIIPPQAASEDYYRGPERGLVTEAIEYYQKLKANFGEGQRAVSAVVWAEEVFFGDLPGPSHDCPERLEHIKRESDYVAHALEILDEAASKKLPTTPSDTSTTMSQVVKDINIEPLRAIRPHIDADGLLALIGRLKSTVHTYVKEIEEKANIGLFSAASTCLSTEGKGKTTTNVN